MRVALFVTCVNDVAHPRVGRAAVELLERLGVEVDFPSAQSCCGRPQYASGRLGDAARLAVHQLRTLSEHDAVVVPSGSCAAMIRDGYPKLVRQDPALAAPVGQITPRVYELSEFLVDVLGVTDVGAHFPHRVAYQPSCRGLRTLGLRERPLELLRRVRGIELVDLPDAEVCCGYGGGPAVADALRDAKLRAAGSSGADVLCATDSSCLGHLGNAVPTVHLAEILASTDA